MPPLTLSFTRCFVHSLTHSLIRSLSLLNTIKPGVVPKIHESKIAYRHMENIGQYLKGCKALGVPVTDLFDTPDLYEERNINLVINHVHSLAAFVKKTESLGFSGPFIEDSKDVKTLFAASLVDTGLEGIPAIKDDVPLTAPQKELVDWVRHCSRRSLARSLPLTH